MASHTGTRGGSHGSSYRRPRSGGVDYPISKDMALTGI